MKIQDYDIIVDIESTKKYRDKYNEQCHCEQCENFRLNFDTYYPEIVRFLQQFGINTYYPLEIMDLGFNEKISKREYIVYYSVKGELPIDKIKLTINNANIVLRNWNIAHEAYANTGMDKPYFIIEIDNIFLKDTKYEFYNAVRTGREIEFSYNGKNYFESRNDDNDWYIYCEETKTKQHFKSAEELLKYTILEDMNINDLWNDIRIDCIF